MSDYNFWADLLDTFQSMDDWLKALALLIPPAFLLGVMGLLLRHRATMRAIESGQKGEFAPHVQDVFDRVDYMLHSAIPFNDSEEMLPAPLVTVRRRD